MTPTSNKSGLGGPVVTHILFGILWLVVFGGALSTLGGPLAAIWIGCSFVLWALSVVRMNHRPEHAWAQIGRWWLETWVAPAALVYEVWWLSTREAELEPQLPAGPPSAAPPSAASQVSAPDPPPVRVSLQPLRAELDELASSAATLFEEARTASGRLQESHARLAETASTIERIHSRADALSRLASRAARNARALEQQAVAPAAPPAPVVAPPPPRPARPARPPRPPGPSTRQRLESAGLLGARGLALAGGIVMLLGVVFLFVLAANRGWIGPEGRVALGATVSALAFAGGLLVKRRYGQMQAALAATGAGIAGGYATLVAAGALYDMVPVWAGLAIASAIALLGATVAVRWRSQTVAALGLVGAIVVPALASIGTGLSVTGTSFVAVVLAATLGLAVRQRWQWLLLAAIAASLPQIAGLVGWPPANASKSVLALAAVFGDVYLTTGLVLAVRAGGRRLDSIVSTLVIGPAALVGWSVYRLVGAESLGGHAVGLALLGIALTYVVLAAAFFSRARSRELSILLGTVALAVGAIGTAALTGGATLAIVWAIEAAALAWLAVRIGEARYQLGAIAYLALALVHVLAFEAPPRLLYEAVPEPASGFWAVVVTAAAALAFGLAARHWPPVRTEKGRIPLLSEPTEALAEHLGAVRDTAVLVAASLALYALSLGILQVAQWSGAGSLTEGFDWGHVLVTAVWAYVGLALVLAGHGGARARPRLVGFVLLGLALCDFLVFQISRLPDQTWATSALALAAALLAAGVADGLRARFDPGVVSIVALLTAAGLATAGIVQLTGGDTQGLCLLSLGALFAVLSAAVFSSRRNLASLLWLEALTLTLAALSLLLDGNWLVAALAAGTVAITLIGTHAHEPRLQLAALAPLSGALAYTLSTLATPHELFTETSTLWDGLIALTLLIAALSSQLTLSKPVTPTHPDTLDHLIGEARARLRPAGPWLVGALCLYAGSLGLLQLAQWLGGETTLSNFEAGRVAVTGLWAVVGAGLVLYGQTGRRPQPWAAGLAVLTLATVDLLAYETHKLPDQWPLAAFLLAAALCVAGVADGLRARFDPGVVSIVALLTAAGLATAGIVQLTGGDTQGLCLLSLGALFAVLSAAVFSSRRNLASLLWLEALTLTLAALSLLLDGNWLVAALAAGTVAITLIGTHAHEPRLQLAALAPLSGALAYTLSTLATPHELFTETSTLWDGLIALTLLIAALSSQLTLSKPVTPTHPDTLDHLIGEARARLRPAGPWLVGALCLYAGSLGLLQLAQWLGGETTLSNFEAGRVAVTGLWAVVGAGLVLYGQTGRRPQPWAAGLAVLTLATVDLLAYETHKLPDQWPLAAFLLAAALCVAGVADGLRARFDPGVVSIVALLTAAGLATAGIVQLTGGDTQGLCLLSLGALFAVLSAAVFSSRRNLASLLWLEALTLTLAALSLLLDGNWLVAALAAGTVAITLIGTHAHEPRLQLAALAPLSGALAYTLSTLATPHELFTETSTLWDGLIALTLLIAALSSQLTLSKPVTPTHPDTLDHLIGEARPRFRLTAVWVLAVLALDVLSLGALQVTAWLGGSFQTGEAAVSAVWSLTALVAITTGLMRGLPTLRLAGFALVGLTLAKIFFYDLGSLSPVARALSFLAVGAILLVAGFFYQRLAGEHRGPRPPTKRPPTARPAAHM